MIRPVINLIRALQSNVSPAEIASGAALSLFFGFTPLNHPHTVILVLCFFFFKINRAATVLLLPLVKLLYILGAVHLADKIGGFLLIDYQPLHGFWEWASGAPVLAWLDLNHTLVTGGIALALMAAPFVFVAVWQMVLAYRANMKSRVDKLGAVQWMQRLAITRWLMTWWPKD